MASFRHEAYYVITIEMFAVPPPAPARVIPLLNCPRLYRVKAGAQI